MNNQISRTGALILLGAIAYFVFPADAITDERLDAKADSTAVTSSSRANQ